jgi:transposase
MALGLREVTDDELAAITRLAHARTAAARPVERARIVLTAHAGAHGPASAAQLGGHEKTARRWITRCNAEGLAGLADAPRSGRPAPSTPEEVGAVVAAALPDPQALGLPFGCWTYERLEAHRNEGAGIPSKRNRINEILLAEGLRWHQPEPWFGERVDPAFARNRGRSRPAPPPRTRAAA